MQPQNRLSQRSSIPCFFDQLISQSKSIENNRNAFIKQTQQLIAFEITSDFSSPKLQKLVYFDKIKIKPILLMSRNFLEIASKVFAEGLYSKHQVNRERNKYRIFIFGLWLKLVGALVGKSGKVSRLVCQDINSNFNSELLIYLIQMILRAIVRGIASASKLAFRSSALLAVPQYSFTRKIEKTSPSFTSIIEQEIKAEESNLTDLSDHVKNFQEKGWTISKQDVLVELSKTVGNYTVRLLSSIKSPTNFGQNEQGKEKENQQEQGEEDYQGEMNEVTICVTKKGSEKTMTVHTIVTQGFEISALNFAPTYQDAKKNRLDVFTSNTYTGPEMESLSDQLFEGIYNFLEQECEITDELLESFGDYCIDAEQAFYINWLKDLKQIV